MTGSMYRFIAAASVLLVTVHAGVATAAPPPIRLPGLPAFDAALQQRLRAAPAAKTKPHGAHVNADGSPQYVNRLVFSSSPYLQQHAFNPVNWYPWGDEAFATAQRENKPIFLSIGYSTCHWCHVMERECFENEAIAQVLNEHFIAIKVDREERPDVDAVYVAAVQRMTGSAGWPLTVILTPDRKPFYGGTYFPPDDRPGHPGLPKLLATLADSWATKHDDILQASAALSQSLQASAEPATTANLTADVLRKAADQLRQAFDATNGGFGGTPKFPQAHMLQFLLRYAQRSGDMQARAMAEITLEHMGRGGIHDRLGGGFHRYSTDTHWLVPHFEKMLYDQAIDARAYLEAAQAAGDLPAMDVARDTLTYVLRDMTAPDGGFYSAEDADSDGEEGRFYTWTRAEIIAVVGPEHGALIADLFGVTDTGVLPGGRSPLSIPIFPKDFMIQRGLGEQDFARIVAAAGDKLLAARTRRPRPARDEKIITAWNGLMIGSLAYGSTVLNEARYATAAARAADFVLRRLQHDGRLLRSYRNGPSATQGYLDDYAFFISGLTELYAATFDVRWLREADRLSREMIRLFADPATGGLRYTASDHETLIAEPGDDEDAALPSAQSVAALTLLRLGRLTMNDAFESRGRAILAAHSGDLNRAPTAHTTLLMALDFLLGPTKEVVIAGPPDAADTRALLAAARRFYMPRAVIALHAPNDSAIEALVPFLKRQVMVGGQPTAYVCENYICKLPTTDPKKFVSLLTGAPDGASAKQ